MAAETLTHEAQGRLFWRSFPSLTISLSGTHFDSNMLSMAASGAMLTCPYRLQPQRSNQLDFLCKIHPCQRLSRKLFREPEHSIGRDLEHSPCLLSIILHKHEQDLRMAVTWQLRNEFVLG